MDVLGSVNRYRSMKSTQNQMTNNKRRSRSKSKDIKVVYISSPMKVKTSASEFRALVQELTGRHSDTARFMDMTANSITKSDDEDVNHDHHQLKVVRDDHEPYYNNNNNNNNNHDLSFSGGFYDLPSSNTTSKPSLFQPFDHDQCFDLDDYLFSSYDEFSAKFCCE